MSVVDQFNYGSDRSCQPEKQCCRLILIEASKCAIYL